MVAFETMILSDRDIKKALASGRIKITPRPNLDVQLGSCSIDFHLGNRFRIFKHSSHPFIDLKGKIDPEMIMQEVVIPKGKSFVMQPKDFVLAITVESLEIADDLLGTSRGQKFFGKTWNNRTWYRVRFRSGMEGSRHNGTW